MNMITFFPNLFAAFLIVELKITIYLDLDMPYLHKVYSIRN